MKIPRTVITQSVDKERRRSGHAVAHRFFAIVMDMRFRVVAIQILCEPIHIETELACKTDRKLRRERALVVVEPVVHLPEPALLTRRLRGARHEFGAGMGPLIGKMAKDIGQPLAQNFAQS